MSETEETARRLEWFTPPPKPVNGTVFVRPEQPDDEAVTEP